MNLPVVLTIAGSDASGGAGITADLLTMQQLNVHACHIITAATAQNSETVNAINLLPIEYIQSQLSSLQTGNPAAIKCGMLGSVEIIHLLKHYFQHYTGKIVLDPILMSSSGIKLFQGEQEDYIQVLKTVFPFVDLLTPNLPEAENLLNCKIATHIDMVNAANAFISLGVKSVVIKAGHFLNDEYSQDYWTDGKQAFWLSSKRYARKNYRGTGCVFSAAVTASLASGYTMQDALVIAKMTVSRGIRLAGFTHNDVAYLDHAEKPDNQLDLPAVTASPLLQQSLVFPSCGEQALGLYPIVDNSDWLKRLLPLGINTIQLRIKDKVGLALEDEIKTSIALAKQYHARLFINDYWEHAIRYGAYGVHLGQEDLDTADIKHIHAAGLRLGLSSHCYYEVARAYAYKPSYLACGPIFATTSKAMPFQPQGVEKLTYWRKLLREASLVAIGGIDADNFADIMHTGVDGIAMISAITKANDPEQITRQLLSRLKSS